LRKIGSSAFPDGRLELCFKRPWKDGTRASVLEPDDSIVRLAAAVPSPRWHWVRYEGPSAGGGRSLAGDAAATGAREMGRGEPRLVQRPARNDG
jgi:hypothetical protein